MSIYVACAVADRLIAEKFPWLKWIPFHECRDGTRAIGQFLMRGEATFRSGLVRPVFYYVNVGANVPKADAPGSDDPCGQAFAEYLVALARLAALKMEAYRRAPEQGGLLDWFRRKWRPVQSVVWLDWNAPKVQIQTLEET
jgi:hypothetical protein